MSALMSGVDAFNAKAFGNPHPNNVQYFTQQYQDIVQNASMFVGDLGKQFVQAAASVYQQYVSPTALARIRNILRHATNDSANDTIRSLGTLEEFQNASLVMQRWVMAEPLVREKYQAQLIDGYSDTYLDVEPGASGLSHYDYRSVTEGMVEYSQNDEGEVDGLVYVNYYQADGLRSEDRLLEVEEKTDILDVWHNVRVYLRQGAEDPTAPQGGYL